MKKLAALALVAALSATSAFVVSAEEAESEATDEIPVLSLEDTDASVYDGTWVTFAAGFDLYLPSDWNVLELDEDSSMIFQAVAPDESGWSVGVLYASAEDTGEEATIESMLEELGAEDSGYTEVMEVIINDIPVVSYTEEESDVSGFAFVDEAGGVYTVMLYPQSDEDFAATATNIICSFSLSETEGETEAVTEAQ